MCLEVLCPVLKILFEALAITMMNRVSLSSSFVFGLVQFSGGNLQRGGGERGTAASGGGFPAQSDWLTGAKGARE